MQIQFNHLPVVPLRVTSKFGKRNTGIQGASTYHKGIDLGRDFSKPESPVLAVTAGTVTNNYWDNTRGWVVIIDHGAFKTLYQHLKNQCPISKGTKVTAGQQIGIMGASTKTIKNMAVHLHMELIVNGKQIDPEPYLQSVTPIEEEEEMKVYENIEELTGDWKEAVKWAIQKGIIKGNGKTLGLTESEVKGLVFLYRDNLRKGTK